MNLFLKRSLRELYCSACLDKVILKSSSDASLFSYFITNCANHQVILRDSVGFSQLAHSGTFKLNNLSESLSGPFVHPQSERLPEKNINKQSPAPVPSKTSILEKSFSKPLKKQLGVYVPISNLQKPASESESQTEDSEYRLDVLRFKCIKAMLLFSVRSSYERPLQPSKENDLISAPIGLGRKTLILFKFVFDFSLNDLNLFFNPFYLKENDSRPYCFPEPLLDNKAVVWPNLTNALVEGKRKELSECRSQTPCLLHYIGKKYDFSLKDNQREFLDVRFRILKEINGRLGMELSEKLSYPRELVFKGKLEMEPMGVKETDEAWDFVKKQVKECKVFGGRRVLLEQGELTDVLNEEERKADLN